MRTNTPDEGSPEAAFCGGCGRPLKPGAALCTGCGTRRDGEAVKTRVVKESADGPPAGPRGAAVRGSAGGADDEAEERSAGPRRLLGWLVAGIGGLFAVLLLAWGFSGPGGLGGAGTLSARAVRVLPLFDNNGRLLMAQRDEVAAAGSGAAVVVELPAGLLTGPSRPELVPVAGGASASGVPLEPAGDGSAVEIDLAPLAPGGPVNLLPVHPADRYFERPRPDQPERLEATAAYESGGFEGRLRLATGAGEPVTSSGTLQVTSEADSALSASMAWDDERLGVQAGGDARIAWAASGVAPGAAGAAMTLLFVLPPGTPPAVGGYEVRAGDRMLARVELVDVGAVPAGPAPPPVVVGGGTRPGKILPSPIKRANGTAAAPPINTNNPLSYFDILSGASANARGLTSANAMRQLATGFLLYEQSHGGYPDTLDQLADVLGPMDALLFNQRTGDSPGFLYEKPTGSGSQPIVWETIGGQKDPTGAVLMSDGSIR